MKKTQREIDAEIKALQEIKPKVRHFSAFGDDHHKTIELQIKVLRTGLDEDDIADWDSDEYSAAQMCIEWRDGTNDEITSIVDEWKSLVTK